MNSLVIDDVRILNLHGDVEYARTPEKAIKALQKKRKWDAVYFDHDLGTRDWSPVTIWPVISFLEEENQYDPIKIGHAYVITSNPVGAQRMKLALDKMGYPTTVRSADPILAGVIPW